MKLIILIAIGMLLTCYGLSQSLITDSPSAISNEMVKNIAVQQEKFVEQLQRRQKKLLIRLQKQEEKIVSKLRKTDSLKAALLHTDIESKYSLLQQKLEPSVSRFSSPYISRIDSLETMLKWLDPLSNKKQELDKALSAVNGLKVQLSQAQDLQSFITERQQVFKSLLSVDGLMNKLPIKGLSKFVRRYNKEVYYYKERVNSLRETLNTPDKLEKEALSIVRKLPAFQKFMQQNSQLAQLFGAGISDGGTSNTNALAGLQTRASITQFLQQQLGVSNVEPQQFIQQQLGAAQAELAKVKDKLQALRAGGNMGTASEDGGMPSFTPNNQKAKPFLKRLEYGFNLQTGNKAAYDFPASNDLALTLGYRLNDRLVGGIGIAYKFGLGKDWKNISFTHEGIGIRSYIDWKLSAPQKGLKVLFGNLWLTGGYEKNYMSRFRDAAALSQVAWQTSGLLGVSKKIQYKKKELKVSVLWDFLRQRTADGQPFVFRYGYNF